MKVYWPFKKKIKISIEDSETEKDGKIFCDRQINPREIGSMLAMVFMPIALGALSETANVVRDNIGMIYEYLSEAGPRSINGYPIFMSFKTLTKAETDEMFGYFEQYKKLKEDFGGGKKEETPA